ncbi:hypothetical protein ACVWZM_004727 [Bradyrhizobium sp. USDA 4501]
MNSSRWELPGKRFTRWSKLDDQRVIELWEAGRATKEIASELKRSESAIRARVATLARLKKRPTVVS